MEFISEQFKMVKSVSGSQLWPHSCGEEISFEDAAGRVLIEGLKAGKTAGNQEGDGLYTLAKGKLGGKSQPEVKGRSGQLNFTLWIFRGPRDLVASWIAYLPGIPPEVSLAFYHICALCWWYWAVSHKGIEFLLAPVGMLWIRLKPLWFSSSHMIPGWKSNTQQIGSQGFVTMAPLPVFLLITL